MLLGEIMKYFVIGKKGKEKILQEYLVLDKKSGKYRIKTKWEDIPKIYQL